MPWQIGPQVDSINAPTCNYLPYLQISVGAAIANLIQREVIDHGVRRLLWPNRLGNKLNLGTYFQTMRAYPGQVPLLGNDAGSGPG
jgi:hypothetical protein